MRVEEMRGEERRGEERRGEERRGEERRGEERRGEERRGEERRGEERRGERERERESIEVMVFTPKGARYARSVKRIPFETRWTMDTVSCIICTPWNKCKGDVSEGGT